MTEPNFIILIDLDSGKTALQNCILKITKNNGLKSKKKPLRSFDKLLVVFVREKLEWLCVDCFI